MSVGFRLCQELSAPAHPDEIEARAKAAGARLAAFEKHKEQEEGSNSESESIVDDIPRKAINELYVHVNQKACMAQTRYFKR